MALRRRPPANSWDAVADRYRRTAGRRGSDVIARRVHPEVLRLLGEVEGSRILDVGCGIGVLSRKLAARGADVTGIDVSVRAVEIARRDAKESRLDSPPRFEVADAHDRSAYPPPAFDAVVSVLSLQEMDRPDTVLRNVARALRPGGRLILALNHPCFRVPGASSWGWDPELGARFRRVDRYRTAHRSEVEVPGSDGRPERAVVHHWPLERLFRGLRRVGFAVEDVSEPVPSAEERAGKRVRREADPEVPLFLVLLARLRGPRSRRPPRGSRQSG